MIYLPRVLCCILTHLGFLVVLVLHHTFLFLHYQSNVLYASGEAVIFAALCCRTDSQPFKCSRRSSEHSKFA